MPHFFTVSNSIMLYKKVGSHALAKLNYKPEVSQDDSSTIPVSKKISTHCKQALLASLQFSLVLHSTWSACVITWRQFLVNLLSFSKETHSYRITHAYRINPKNSEQNTISIVKNYSCFPKEYFIMIQNKLILNFTGNFSVTHKHRANELRNVNVFKALQESGIYINIY